MHSGMIFGIDAVPVTVEVDVTTGLPGFGLVGLPDSAIKEARERVFSALKNSGFTIPSRRITINLAPADLRKEGTAFDLPIALGILVASEQIEPLPNEPILILGELSLNGSLRPVRGLLSMLLMARQQGWKKVLLPAGNIREASLVPGCDAFPIGSLLEAIQALRANDFKPNIEEQNFPSEGEEETLDFSEIKGQAQAKRALEVAAAGGHNFLMTGSPGCGKTLMARRLPSILPPLSDAEGLDTTRIYSVSGLLKPGHGLMRRRPFRSPHHSISHQALVGGGRIPRPGEVSLAHLGVLFLDELPEFHRSTLESLRQPLEEGKVTIARTTHTLTFPSQCMFGAAMNPCPCGYAGDPSGRCVCNAETIRRYRRRISGPLLDRIDLHLEVPSLSVDEILAERQEEASSYFRERVARARARQYDRFRMHPGIYCNAQMTSREARLFCPLPPTARSLLRKALETLGLSARAYDRILKVARTVADLEGVDSLSEGHIAEAIHYRGFDRKVLGVKA